MMIMRKKSKADLVGLVAIAIMLVGAVIVSYVLITEKIHPCTRDPLKYTVEKVIGDDNITYRYVELRIFLNKNDYIPIKTEVLDLTNQFTTY